MVRILMVLDGHYPTDLRLEKQIPVLLEAGYEVTLVCYRRHGESTEESLNGLKVIRTKMAVTHTLQGYIDILNALFFINIPIRNALNSLKGEFDAVHVHDLPVSNTALSWAEKKNITTVFDVHENYPDALAIWFAWRKSILVKLKNRLFFNYRIWMRREERMIHRFDHIIAIIDEMRDRIIQKHGVLPEKLSVVSNTEPKGRFDGDKVIDVESGPLDIVYVGGVGPHRGLDVAIAAMPEILKFNSDFKLVVVGSGNPDNMNHLQKIASDMGVLKKVEFTGRKPFGEALGYMKGAFMNIIPHLKIPQTDNGIPHKLFQIMNSKYPLMVSSCEPLKRIVQAENCGLVFEAGNPKDFAEQIIWAFEHPRELKLMTENARNAIQFGRWNWEYDAAELLKLYQNITLKLK